MTTARRLRLPLSTLAALVVCCASAMAIEPPSGGLTYNTREDSSITFNCRKVDAQEIECDLNQTAVRRVAKPEDWAERESRAKSQYRSGTRLDADTCKMAEQIVAVMEGRATPPKGNLATLNPIQRRDFLASGKALQTACLRPTEDNFIAIARAEHSQALRTCRVSSNAFTQRFTAAPNSGGATWIQRSQPEGPCGIVQLNRFEAAPQKIGTSDFVFWKYIARKAITNPNGKFLLGSCSGLDQSEYEYDWQGDERALGGDYIKFSP